MTVLPAYDGMVVRSRTKVRQPLIDVCPNLKVIVRGGAGLDTIDHEYAKSKGITVMNTPLANGLSVAELALGYMFMLARSLYKATATMKAEKWEKKSFNGDELGGKTLGIIGYGNIGHAIARLANALDMKVVAYDPYVTSQNGAKMVALDELLAEADYITLHLPKTKESANMIGAEQFAKMKNGVRIINCARGGIINEDALYDALVSGKVAGTKKLVGRLAVFLRIHQVASRPEPAVSSRSILVERQSTRAAHVPWGRANAATSLRVCG